MRGGIYEVYYVYGYIVQAHVMGRIEMRGNFTFGVVLGDFEKVRCEAHLQLAFSLSDILDAAPFARNAVDEIGAAAAHIVPAHVRATRSRA